MPILSDLANLGRQYGPMIGSGIGGLLNRSAIGSAADALTAGANQAMGTITQGANQARGTLADLYKQQIGFLQPYNQAGQGPLNTLQQGLQPGGQFATPYNM